MVSWFDLLDAFEVKTLDARFRHRRREHIDDRIVLLCITDKCIEKLGNWPWPRSLHAKAVDLLASAGARMVVFDVIFRDPDRANPQEDESFIQTCTKFGKVVFPPFIEQIRLFDPDSLDLRTEYEVARPFDRLASTALENARLYNLATVDALTRPFVRRYCQVQIDQEFQRARRYHHRLALLMTDIDHCKRFNDTYGHQQGDNVLPEVAGAVKRSL